jgi:hypothetical protein
MRTGVFASRLIVVLCLAAVLFAALTAGSSGELVAVLVPQWFFCAAIVSVAVRSVTEPKNPYQSPFLPVVTPRPPPVG